MGTRKLYEMLQPFLLEHQIKIGRDALFDMLAKHKLLVKKRKRRISTTMSYHQFHKWPNLIKELAINRPNQLYVSDITYWKTKKEPAYISLITDAYSHKVVGYHVAENMAAIESKQALIMALNGLSKDQMQGLFHHSDRGSQYCSGEYVKLLKDNGILISMTESGEPTDNAIAERMNGILKEEYLNHYQVEDISEARDKLSIAINLYNQERPHMSIGNLKPNEVHDNNLQTEKLWKNYYQLNQRKEKAMT
jgi:transposase InsO family protein